MGLTSPLALFLGALLALPVLAHLLRRADVRSVRLPTVALLSRAAVESRRRPRLVDPWLLALRIAAFALLVLGLAAPFVERELAFGDGRLASVSIVIDDSMSMSRRLGSATVDAEARARAIAIVEALPDGSEVSLVAGGSPARILLPRTAERALALDLLRGGEPAAGTARSDTLATAVGMAGRQLAGARHALRRIVVLTDGRGRASDATFEVAPGIALSFERIGGEDPAPNVAITRSNVEVRGERVALSVAVRAVGLSVGAVPIELVRGATVVAQADVALEGGEGEALIELPAEAVSRAALEVDPTATVRIATSLDGLPADDAVGVLLRPPSAPRVVLVDRGSATAPSRFLERALLLAPREHGGPVAVRHIEPLSLSSVAPGSIDVLVLCDLDLRDTRLAEAVRAIAASGAGVLVTGGPHAGAGSDARLRELLPAHVEGEASGTWGLVRPAGSLLDGDEAGLPLVRVTSRSVLELADGASELLTFDDGAPALVWSRASRTAVLATTLDDAWTDWPYRPAFLPAVVRMVTLLARPGTMPDEPRAAGALPSVVIDDDARGVAVVEPSGAVAELPATGTPPHVSLEGFSAAGAYAVSFVEASGNRTPAPRAAFVLAPDASESDLTVLPLPEPTEGAATESGPSLVRTDLSPWLYLLVGLFAVLEGALRLRRSEPGSAVGAT